MRPAGPSATRRRALCIGIDDYPTARLFGCVNDARLWRKTFEDLRFDSVGLLTNEQASYAGILAALEQMVTSANPGDALVVQFAGHGTQVEDLDGDEAAQTPPDNLDEALVPFDYQSGLLIIDDDLGRVFDKLPKGVGLTVFLDCCHSGTATRAFSLKRNTHASGEENERYLALDRDSLKAFRDVRKRESLRSRSAPESMQEVTFAACQPSQTAKEKNGHGYFTLAATAILSDGLAGTNAGFLKLVSEGFPLPPSSQLPHLHCSEATLDLPLFAIASFSAQAIASSTASREAAATDPSDRRLLMETMKSYLEILERLTPA